MRGSTRLLSPKLVSKEGKDWDRLLPYVFFAYREVPQSTTVFSLLYGREVRGPLDVLREEWEASKKSDESVSSQSEREIRGNVRVGE